LPFVDRLSANGTTTLTAMPWSAASKASDRVSPWIAPFAAQYSSCCGVPKYPALEPVLTMRP
jgi:hypothetical protein